MPFSRLVRDMRTRSQRIGGIWRNDGLPGVLGIAILLPVASFLVYDLLVDALFKGEFGSAHFIVEAVAFVSVLGLLSFGLRNLTALRARLKQEKIRNRALAGELAEGIDAQMGEWKLTHTERDIAWMILKGYRFSEIAELRRVKESTTRLQASAVYAKAGVRGRAEFVAEIIQRLLTPILEDPSSDAERSAGCGRP